jgi:hypothetical protein
MSYISRNYTNEGLYPISLTGGRKHPKKVSGGRKMRVPKMFKDAEMYIMGGNCGCSGCMTGAGFDVEALQGGNFFDWLANKVPFLAGQIPLFGKLLGPAAEMTLDILEPYRKNPRNPREPEVEPPGPVSVYHPTAQTGKYLTDQYNQALAEANRGPQRPAGAGFFEDVGNFMNKHKRNIFKIVKAGKKLYGNGRIQPYPYKYSLKDRAPPHDIPRPRMKKMNGAGLREFYEKHKNKIHNVGKAALSAAALAAAALAGKKGYDAYDRYKWFNKNVGPDGFIDV